MRRRALLPLLLAAGCADPPPPGFATIAPGLGFAVPPPWVLGLTVSLAQSVRAEVGGMSLAFEAQLDLTPEALRLAALDGFGRRLLTLEWTREGLMAETAPELPAAARPANMLADLALAFWPEAALRPALAEGGALLEASATRRVVVLRGLEVVSIEYRPEAGWQARALYRNDAFGYSLDIQSILLGP